MTQPEAEQILKGVVHLLGEHFEAAQIMVTWHDGEDTSRLFTDAGNWYARMGLAQEFVNVDKARDLAQEVGKVLESDEE